MTAQTIRAYYRLTKPGVLYGNVLTTVAGFLFASRGSIDIVLFLATVIGTTLVIASACVLNNYLDQDIDQKMERTRQRPLVAGEVSSRGAVVFTTVLGVLGVTILSIWVNTLVVAIGLAGFVTYVVLYGMLSKRLSWHGTLVGSVSGAVPILAGYVAVSNQLDLGAWLLFTILFFWQFPEFYSIAIFRRREYEAAGVPVITVVKGIDFTKMQICAYTIAFSIVVLALMVSGYAGRAYGLVMGGLCGYWLWTVAQGFRRGDTNVWARQVFRQSLIILLVFSLLISLDAWLP